MKYEIVKRSNLIELVETVNDKISLGWEPIGAFVVFFTYNKNTERLENNFCQTIIREE